MPNFPQGPMVGGPQGAAPGGQQIKIDLNTIDDAQCIRCGATRFIRAGVIKVLSKLVSPNGREVQANVERMECSKCHWPFDLNQYLAFQKELAEQKEKEKNED